MSLGLIYDPLFLEHDTGNHPENADRLRTVERLLEERGHLSMWRRLRAEAASSAELSRVHSEGYLESIERFAREGGRMLTLDTAVSRRSFEVATLAAGAMVRATTAVLDGEVDRAFALVRPPGHHARPAQGMGFCLINNVAVAARHATSQRGLSRVVVLDFDVHHGNGTEGIFYDDPGVLYLSPHQFPAYPGTGAIRDTGTGDGQGFTLNVPLPEGTGDAGYRRVFRELLEPAVYRYRPELILVSAGYDAHWSNTRYLSSIRMTVTVSGFVEMVRSIRKWADDLCGGRLALVLEGGYDPRALAWSVLATLQALNDAEEIEDPIGPPASSEEPDISAVIDQARAIHGL